MGYWKRRADPLRFAQIRWAFGRLDYSETDRFTEDSQFIYSIRSFAFRLGLRLQLHIARRIAAAMLQRLNAVNAESL